MSYSTDGVTVKKRAGPKISDAIAAKREHEVARDRGQRVVASAEPFIPWALEQWLPNYSGRSSTVISERTRAEYRRDLNR